VTMFAAEARFNISSVRSLSMMVKKSTSVNETEHYDDSRQSVFQPSFDSICHRKTETISKTCTTRSTRPGVTYQEHTTVATTAYKW
jgi:hypothetical protein